MQFWWKSGLVIGVVALVVGVHATWTTLTERHLLQNGLPILARFTEVRTTSREGYAQPRDDSMPVKLKWTMPGGQEVKVSAILPPGPGYAKVGETLRIRVDKNNPQQWTEQKELLPWWRVLTIPLIMMLPISVLLFAIALWQRWRVLRVWRNGRHFEALVIDSRNVSTAPRSRLVRYSLAEGSDKRIFSMLFPLRAGVPRDGEMFDVLAISEIPGRAIAAVLYLDKPRMG